MEVKQLEEIADLIRSKQCSRASVMEIMGKFVIEDIAQFVKDNDRLPESKEITDKYKELPHYEVTLGMIDIIPMHIDRFVGILLKDAEISDFVVNEFEKVKE